MTLGIQIIWLFILALPIACISWTVTHEEIFREPREFCEYYSKNSRSYIIRKFCYLFTCEYCFSHYVTLFFLIFTQFTLLYTNWLGYVIAGFALVWIANIYMNLYALIRVDLRVERMSADVLEEERNDLRA